MSKKRTPQKLTPTAVSKPGSPMDTGFVEQLMQLMAANDLNTVDLRDGERRVILKRGPVGVAMPAGYAAPPPAIAPPTAPPASAGGDGGAAVAPSAEANLVPIKSPMVGTFYTSPKPGEKPYVTIGSRVVKDETDVCMIEAMKNFFPQKADVTGTIVKVLIENGQPVQSEMPMFLVKPE